MLTKRTRLAALRFWLSILGRVYYWSASRNGEYQRSERCFRRLVAHDEHSYIGHLFLGLIAESRFQHKRAISQFARAYQIDPKRFNRSQLPNGLRDVVMWQEGLKGALSMNSARLRPANSDPSSAQMNLEAVELVIHPARSAIEIPPSFSSLAEYQRFASLPPIEAADIAAVDFDELGAQLTRSQ